MRTFIFKTGVFIVEFIILFIIPILFISRYDNLDKNTSENHNIISLQNKSLYDSLDVLFVGNSYCYSSINTALLDSLNISSYNLGIATAGVDFYELVLNDYFENISLPPDKVLLLVTPMTLSSKSDNFMAYPIHRYLENEKSNLEIAIKYDRYDRLISMYRKSFKKALNEIFFGRTKGSLKKERFNNKGYFPSNKIFDKHTISDNDHVYKSFKNEKFNKSKVEDLVVIANEIKKKGAEVIFFELPTNMLKNYFGDKYLLDYENSLTQLEDNFELIRIDQSKFSVENFRNIDHMNNSGANIATKEVVNFLLEK